MTHRLVLLIASATEIAIMPCGFDIERTWREMPARSGGRNGRSCPPYRVDGW